ncbi:MAG: hypothetical protein C5S49_03460 [Candidatus Methanogaster sp.]|nr:MAG: hypothetical protein C5S49_03460 [ANME-2 cluster archaeon]
MPHIHAVRASSQASRAAERHLRLGVADGCAAGGCVEVQAEGGGRGHVCRRRAAVGGGCAAQRDSQMRASPSDLDFQPVPVHGKKLNRRLIMDI